MRRRRNTIIRYCQQYVKSPPIKCAKHDRYSINQTPNVCYFAGELYFIDEQGAGKWCIGCRLLKKPIINENEPMCEEYHFHKKVLELL